MIINKYLLAEVIAEVNIAVHSRTCDKVPIELMNELVYQN
jgi:hypothetical protein